MRYRSKFDVRAAPLVLIILGGDPLLGNAFKLSKTLDYPTITLYIYFYPVFVINLIFACPCIVSTIVNDQKDAAILAYLFIPDQLYMFRSMSSPIIRST